MDASDVGVQCSLCKHLDFLPITCKFCQAIFCKDHSSAASHSCSADNTISINEGNRYEGEHTFSSLLPDRTSAPTERFDREEAAQKRKDYALEVLQKNFGQVPSKSTPHKLVTKPVHPKIALMKLKGKAKQGDPNKSVPVDERIYLEVTFFDGEVEKDQRQLWFSQSCSFGKACDLLASHFKVTNVNNTSTDQSKYLSLHYQDMSKCDTSKTLSSGIENGGHLYFIRGFVEKLQE